MLKRAGEFGIKMESSEMPIMAPQPIPRAPPHIKNYSLGAL